MVQILLYEYNGYQASFFTGYTRKSGRCLVSAAERSGVSLIAVTLNAPDDWNDHTALLDWAFSSRRVFRAEGVCWQVPVLSGTALACTAVPETAPSILLEVGEQPVLRAALPRFVFAPLEQGQPLGTLTVTAPDGRETTVPLVCAENIPADGRVPLSFPERLGRFFRLAGRAFFSFNPKF